MNKFCDNIKFVRELLKISQQNIASKINVPQPSYARYEAGITKKIPYSVLNKIATQFGISKEWLISGEINENYCYEIESTIRLNQLSVEEIAKKLGVTTEFLTAIMEGQVSPLKDFFEQTMRAIGVVPQGNLKEAILKNITDYSPGGEKHYKLLTITIELRDAEIKLLQEALGEKIDECEALKNEVAKLKAENAQLKMKKILN